jgi:uncharacterized protein (TIRG00374 family)
MPIEQQQIATTNSAAKARHWIIAILIAAACLYFSLRGIRWGDVWTTIAHANPLWVFYAIVISTSALMLRALRWRVLLRSRRPVSFATAFWATTAGYFGNNYLPARAGELIRTFYVSSQTGLPNLFVLTTALTERLSDAVALVLISSVVLLTMAHPPGWFARAAEPFAIIGLAGALAIILLPLLEALWRKIILSLPISRAVVQKLLMIMEQVLSGIRAFHDHRRLARFAGLTLLIWCLDAIGTLTLMRSLGMHASIGVAFLLITSLGLGSALPSTPGYVGIYQFVAVTVLVPFGFTRSDAIAYILFNQALNYVATGVWGLIAFSRARITNWRSLISTAEAETPVSEA